MAHFPYPLSVRPVHYRGLLVPIIAMHEPPRYAQFQTALLGSCYNIGPLEINLKLKTKIWGK